MPSCSNTAFRVAGTLFLALFFVLTALSASAQDGGVRLKTVVIDAGHGGHDPGAISKSSKLSEKQINLDLALRLGARIEKEFPDVKVMTPSRGAVISDTSAVTMTVLLPLP